jgi:hypothetical protein
MKKDLGGNQEARIKRNLLPPQINKGVELMLRRKKEVDSSDKSEVIFNKTFKILHKYFKFTLECYED